MAQLNDVIAAIVAREAAVISVADDLDHPEREPIPSDKLQIESDWQLWLDRLFSTYCTAPFAPHHEDHWDWAWSIEPNVKADPRVEVWSRGHAKSTSAEMTCVAWGARRVRRCGLYICGTQKQAERHARAVESMLVSPGVRRYYPALSERQLSQYGHSRGWTGQMLVTADGLVIFFVGLDCDYRGVRWEEARPDFFVFDDVDGRHDSLAITQKKIEIITESLLPAGAPHAITLFVQNLIAKDSIASQLADGRAQFLAKRKVSGPYPALRSFAYEKRKGEPGHNITSGEPTWAGMPVEKCQAVLDEIGLEAFLRECQHEVKTTPEGALFEEWSEVHHVITWSEFSAFYGRMARDGDGDPCIPFTWNLGKGQDWGTTVKHPCVTGWIARPYESHELSDSFFMYRELVRPQWPMREDPPMPVSPMKIAGLMQAAEEPWGESDRMSLQTMSHEATAALNTYLYDTPEDAALYFSKWKPDRRGGIPQIQNYLSIDWDQPHPFRKHPETGEPIMGRPRLYFIVADGQGELYIDAEGKLSVRGAIDSAGFIRGRAEIPAYRNKRTATGEERNDPNKQFDDFIDMLKGLMSHFGIMPAALTDEDRFELALPEALRAHNVVENKKLKPDEMAGLWMARQMAAGRIKREQEQDNPFTRIYERRRRNRMF